MYPVYESRDNATFGGCQLRKVGWVLVGLFVLGGIGSLFDSNPQTGGGSSVTRDTADAPLSTLPPRPTTTVQVRPPVSKKQMKVALSRTRVSKDEVEGKTWYRAKSSPAYVNQNGFFLYIGKDEGAAPYFRFRIQYYGDEWLFIDSFVINVDGVKYNISTSYGDIERDNDTEVWEWYDVSPSTADIEMLRAVSTSKRTVVRMNGDQYYKDVVINSTQKQALKTMFTVFQGLGGDLESP